MGRRIVGMAGKVAGPRGSWRRRWSFVLSLVIAVSAAMLVKQTVLAVHELKFELDTPGVLPGGAGANVTTESGTTDDWDEVCFAVTGDARCGTAGDLDATVTAAAWSADCPASFAGDSLNCADFDLVPAAKNASVFTGGGSKDPQPIENWLWKDGAVPQKDNLLHAFAVRYSITSSASCPGPGGDITGATKCDVLYFGSDRWDNDGAAQQAFWFLQSQVTLGGAAGGGGTHFTGSHVNDDVLVISNFSQGGAVSTITVYKWNTTCLGAGKPLAACSSPNLERLTPLDQASNCYTLAAGDAFCGVVNNVDDGEPPWPFRDAENSTSYRTNELFEAGVNLSAFPGLTGKCFATVVSETRASPSPTATLQDFVLESFGECTSAFATAPAAAVDRDAVAAGLQVFPGDDVTDTVTNLTVTGATDWTGTVNFFICAPSELTPANTGTCVADDGTAIGSVSVDQDTDISTIISDIFDAPNTPGLYCFRGVFDSTTTGVPDDEDESAGECFTVIQIQPSISTAQTWIVSDTATLTATGGGLLNGTLTFTLLTGVTNTTTCTGTTQFEQAIQVVDAASGASFTTTTGVSNRTFMADGTTALWWRVTYASTNNAQKGVIHKCQETSTLTMAGNGTSSSTTYP